MWKKWENVNKAKIINKFIIIHKNNRQKILEIKLIKGKEVNINQYYKGKFFGAGAFGKCYEFQSEDDYAGKIIDTKKCS